MLSYLTFVHDHNLLASVISIELLGQERIFTCSNNEMVEVLNFRHICEFTVFINLLLKKKVTIWANNQNQKIKNTFFQDGFALSWFAAEQWEIFCSSAVFCWGFCEKMVKTLETRCTKLQSHTAE